MTRRPTSLVPLNVISHEKRVEWQESVPLNAISDDFRIERHDSSARHPRSKVDGSSKGPFFNVPFRGAPYEMARLP